MAGKNLFEITFEGTEELLKIAERRAKLLDANVRAAVGRTVLWGAARIAEDCPVDTGRLRASILGYLVQKYGLSVNGDPKAVAEGQSQSLTQFEGYVGRIGTNVEYATHVEYGHKVTGPKALTPKQRRYLFAVGILKGVNGGVNGRVVISNIHRRINKRAGIVSRVKGKGFFRRNLVLIDRYFQDQMREAIRYTEQDQAMPITF